MQWIIVKILDAAGQRYDFVYNDVALSEVKIFGSDKEALNYAKENLGSQTAAICPMVIDFENVRSITVQRRRS